MHQAFTEINQIKNHIGLALTNNHMVLIQMTVWTLGFIMSDKVILTKLKKEIERELGSDNEGRPMCHAGNTWK